MYLITDDKTRECAVVDPAEPDEVRSLNVVFISNHRADRCL